MSLAVPVSVYRELLVRLGKRAILQIDRDITDLLQSDNGASLSADPVTVQSIIAAASGFLAENKMASGGGPCYEVLPETAADFFSRNQAADIKDAYRISRKAEQYNRVRSMIVKQIALEELKASEIRILIKSGIDPAALQRMKYLSFLYGTVKSDLLLTDIKDGWFFIKYFDHVLVIIPAEEKDHALKMLRERGFEELSGIVKPEFSPEDSETASLNRIRCLKKRMARLDDYFHSQVDQWIIKMSFLCGFYSAVLKITGAESVIGFSREIAVINGWIDLRDADALNALLREVCGEHYYLKIASQPENLEYRGRIPVLLNNSFIFRPFELLVKLMGFPGNSEVDPTPAAAVAYVIIFGVMFGDAGQGLVLALAGCILKRYGMKKQGERSSISDFGSIMTWCGFSAVTFGFLYGSVFSNEHLIPAVLFHPMENMMQLFLMAIMMGAVFISSGLILNIINGIIAGDYGESLFGTKGAAGLIIYMSFVFFTLRYVLTGVSPAELEIALPVILPAVMFFARGPLERIFFRGDEFFPQGIFEYAVESVIEVIEMFSGFLGNTISFIRAGAFALSHAGLSIAVYTLAGIVDPSMKGAAAFAVIVLGNIFIIALEGLVCAIQSMRLEYYEFFGKFFKGDGTGFTPFSLKLNS